MKAIEATLLEFEEAENLLLIKPRRGVDWRHSDFVEEWLRSMVIGTCLNVCCGDSLVGDVRVDIAPDAKGKTEDGDLFNLRFERGSFDTVICDPPFSYYNKFRWVLRLADITRKRLMLSAGLVRPVLRHSLWEERLFGIGGGGVRMLRLYWVFDRKVRPL